MSFVRGRADRDIEVDKWINWWKECKRFNANASTVYYYLICCTYEAINTHTHTHSCLCCDYNVCQQQCQATMLQAQNVAHHRQTKPADCLAGEAGIERGRAIEEPLLENLY